MELAIGFVLGGICVLLVGLLEMNVPVFQNILRFVRMSALLIVSAAMLTVIGMIGIGTEATLNWWVGFYVVNMLYLAFAFTLKAFGVWNKFKKWVNWHLL